MRLKLQKSISFSFVFILLILLSTVSGQKIQIQEINNERGYVILQQGKIDLPSNFDETIVTINKTELELAYIELETEFNKKSYLQTNLTKRYLALANNERKMFKIRHKRGAFNAIGTGLKYLFGTLDEEDKNDIYNRLSTLEQETLSKDDIDNILNHIMENNKLLYILENSTNIMQNELTKKIVSDAFLDNVKAYYEHLKEIQLGLLLSRQGILNPKLFEIEELGSIDSKQLELTKTSLWQLAEVLYFVIQIPIDMQSYPILRVIPIPSTKDNSELAFDSKKILTNVNETLFEIKNSKLEEIHDICIKNLLNNNFTVCNFKQNFEKEVLFIEPNTIVTKNLDELFLNQTCSNLAIKIKKNTIINFENCSVIINNVKFSSFKQNLNLYVPYVNEIKNKTILPNVSLKELKIGINKLKEHNYKLTWSI